MKKVINILLGLLIILNLACEKEVLHEDYSQNYDFIQNLNIPADYATKLFRKSDGGYIMTYTVTVNGSHTDIGVAVVDEFGNLIRNTVTGGKLDERIQSSAMDDNENVYIVGTTNSPGLRLDQFSDQADFYDGYIAKFDRNGNKLWERGYSDTVSGAKGGEYDAFYNVFISNNRIYCIGETRNYYHPPDNSDDSENWLVVFDEDGNKVRERTLPSVHVDYFWGARIPGAIQLADGDIILKWCTPEVFGTGGHDTTAMMLRYDPESDAVLWINYYLKGSDGSDILPIGQNSDGSIITLNSYNSTAFVYDPSNGNLIKSEPTNIEEFEEEGIYYEISDYQTIHGIGDEHYIIGAMDHGQVLSYANGYGYYRFNNSVPWILKLTEDGKTVYNKFLDLKKSAITDIVATDNGNMKVVGYVRTFGSKNTTLFLMTIDKDGNVIKPSNN